MLFAIYCQAHSAVEAVNTPAAISLRWGVLAGAPAGLLLWAVVRWHHRLATLAGRGACAAMAFAFSLFLLLTIGGGVSHVAVSGLAGGDLVWRITDNAFDLMPVAAALSLLASTWLWSRRCPAPAPVKAEPKAPDLQPEWIVLPEEPRLGLRARDVAVVRSAGNYCELNAAGRVHLVRIPMKVMAERLAMLGFVQVHRTAIVNLAHLRAVEPAGHGVAVRLACGAAVPVGRAYRAKLDTALASRSSPTAAVRP